MAHDAPVLFCFGLGYSAEVFALRVLRRGWAVRGTSRSAERRRALEAKGFTMVPFDRKTPVPPGALAGATHVLTSAAPDESGDPVLAGHAEGLTALPTLGWVAYLGSTAVYGNRDGAWVNEETPIDPEHERGARRAAAERAWLATGLPVHLFRIAGIYGPGRNVLARLERGTARRIVRPGQAFSRIHVEDIANVLEASVERPKPGTIYNVSDDEPAPASDVLEYAAGLLGVEPPPAVALEDADLSPMARSFYADSRRVSNARIREDLGVELLYPTYREGLAALLTRRT